MATNKTFGQWLRAERDRKNLTPKALAGAAGVTPQYIFNLENDVPTKNGALPRPSSAVCIQLANALGVHYMEALRAAGHAPSDTPESEVKARMAADYVGSLPDDKQDEAVGYLKFLFEKFGDKGKMRERSPKHAGVVREGESHPDPVSKTPPRLNSSIGSRKRNGEQADSERAAKKRGRNGS